MVTRERDRGGSEAVTRTLVSRDVGFLMGLLRSLLQRQAKGDTGATWLLLTYLDWASLVGYEVRGLPHKGIAIPGAEGGLRYEQQLAESRHSTKLLDDTKHSVEDQLRALRSYPQTHREQLIDMTRAPTQIRRIPWLGRLQEDTAVVLCDGEVIATTPSMRYHLGLEMNSDGAVLFERGEELGAFLGAVSDEEAERWAEQTLAAALPIPIAHSMDTRYAEFFGETFTGVPIPESIALSTIACRLRAALVVGEAAQHAGEFAKLASFKFRFAVTWQVASTLRTILDNRTTFDLNQHLVEDLRRIQEIEGVAAMAGEGFRRLRNVLVHYYLHDHYDSMIDWDDPLLGLTRALCAKTLPEVEAVTDEAAVAMIQMLDSWRGAIDHLLREPV